MPRMRMRSYRLVCVLLLEARLRLTDSRPASVQNNTLVPTVHAVGYGAGFDLEGDDATDVLLRDTYAYLPSLK